MTNLKLLTKLNYTVSRLQFILFWNISLLSLSTHSTFLELPKIRSNGAYYKFHLSLMLSIVIGRAFRLGRGGIARARTTTTWSEGAQSVSDDVMRLGHSVREMLTPAMRTTQVLLFFSMIIGLQMIYHNTWPFAQIH